MIKSSVPFISGVIFSGGEPTMQQEGLTALARYVKKLGLAVGIHTNGFFPGTLESLIAENLADKISIDYKTTWEGYSGTVGGYYPVVKENYTKNVSRSIGICKKAFEKKTLGEFEVVFTIFYENQEYLQEISKKIGNVPLVLQQGEHKLPVLRTNSSHMTNGEYIYKKQIQQEKHPALKLDEIQQIAEKLEKPVRIRTREQGEVFYEGHRGRRASRKW
jgi:pyruvate formate lyase activating enzyme